MPLGGIGTGGIVRNYQGAFSRWTLKTGALKHFILPANMFSVRQEVLNEGGPTASRKPWAAALHPWYPLGDGRCLRAAPTMRCFPARGSTIPPRLPERRSSWYVSSFPPFYPGTIGNQGKRI